MMVKNLIDLWYSFATTNVPSFNGFKIEGSAFLKILSNENFEIIKLDNKFGESEFWQNVEDILLDNSTDFSRRNDEL